MECRLMMGPQGQLATTAAALFAIAGFDGGLPHVSEEPGALPPNRLSRGGGELVQHQCAVEGGVPFRSQLR